MISNIKLIKKETIARGTMAFHWTKPEGLEYRAGQFADFTLITPPETDAEGDTRGFSLVSAPADDEIVFATRMRDTAFKRVVGKLTVGSEIKFDGPYGDFTLHKTQTTPAVFLTGGIGMTPVHAMIAQATHDKTAHKMTLLHANKSLEDAPYQAEFVKLATGNPNFTFIPVLTEAAADNWRGERGRVDEAMLRRHIRDLSIPMDYLSGPEGMVKAMRQLLVGIGVNEDNIRTEEFSGY